MICTLMGGKATIYCCALTGAETKGDAFPSATRTRVRWRTVMQMSHDLRWPLTRPPYKYLQETKVFNSQNNQIIPGVLD